MKICAVFSDGDGTFYRGQLIVEVLRKLRKRYPRIADVLKTAKPALHAYHRRQGLFTTYTDLIVREFWEKRAYVGLKRSDVHAAAKRVLKKDQERTYVFTRELVAAAQSIGWPVIVVSGSLQEAVEEFMRFFGVTEIIATTHAVDADGVYTDAELHRNPAKNKGPAVREYATAHDIDLDRSVAIGDSHGDIPMLELVGYPLCFNPNGALRSKAQEESWPIILEVRDQLYFSQGTHPSPWWHTGIPDPLRGPLRTRLPRSMYQPQNPERRA